MLWADFPGRLNPAGKNWESPQIGALLSGINLGCCSGKHVHHVHLHSVCVSLVFVWQFHDLLSQTTSPLSQLDPYTSRSMDMLLPLAESDRRRRALEQDCSISLRSFSERPRSVVSLSFSLHFDHCERAPNRGCEGVMLFAAPLQIGDELESSVYKCLTIPKR